MNTQPVVNIKSERKNLRFTSLIPEIGTIMTCTVTYIESPSEFYLQPCDSSLTEVMAQVADQCRPDGPAQPLSVLRSGEPCLARYAEDNIWYRAEIVEVTTSRVVVKYVDYGNTSNVESSLELRAIVPELMELPVQVLQCSVFGLVPPENQEWTDHDIDIFVKAVENREFKVKLKEKNSDNTWMVELIDIKILLDTARNMPVVEKMQTESLPCEDLNVTESLPCEDLNVTESLPCEDLNVTESIACQIPEAEIPLEPSDVIISLFLSPDDFYVQFTRRTNSYEKQQMNIQKICGSLPPLSRVEEGQLVLAPRNETMHRARVIAVRDNKARCLYFDIGHLLKVVRVGLLLPLPITFCEESAFAIRCKLVDIVPDPGPEWQINLCVPMFSSKCRFELTVINTTTEGQLEVELKQPHLEKYMSQCLVVAGIAKLTRGFFSTPVVSLGDDCQVFVSALEGDLIHLQPASVQSSLDYLQVALQHCAPHRPKFKNEDVEKLAAVRSQRDGQWYRALPIGDPYNEGLPVYFVDFGLRDTVWEVKELSPALNNVPRLSVPCRLPCKLLPGASQVLETMLLDECATITAHFLCQTENTFIVDLNVSDVDLTQHLIMSNLATPLISEAYLSYGESPTYFFMQPVDLEEALEEMQVVLASQEFQTLPSVSVGDLCIAQCPDGSWYRAKITSTDGPRVLFIDYGNSSEASQLRAMPDEMAIFPAIAKQCQLSSVMETDMDRFTELCADFPFQVLWSRQECDKESMKVVLLRDGKDVMDATPPLLITLQDFGMSVPVEMSALILSRGIEPKLKVPDKNTSENQELFSDAENEVGFQPKDQDAQNLVGNTECDLDFPPEDQDASDTQNPVSDAENEVCSQPEIQDAFKSQIPINNTENEQSEKAENEAVEISISSTQAEYLESLNSGTAFKPEAFSRTQVPVQNSKVPIPDIWECHSNASSVSSVAEFTDTSNSSMLDQVLGSVRDIKTELHELSAIMKSMTPCGDTRAMGNEVLKKQNKLLAALEYFDEECATISNQQEDPAIDYITEKLKNFSFDGESAPFDGTTEQRNEAFLADSRKLYSLNSKTFCVPEKATHKFDFMTRQNEIKSNADSIATESNAGSIVRLDNSDLSTLQVETPIDGQQSEDTATVIDCVTLNNILSTTVHHYSEVELTTMQQVKEIKASSLLQQLIAEHHKVDEVTDTPECEQLGKVTNSPEYEQLLKVANTPECEQLEKDVYIDSNAVEAVVPTNTPEENVSAEQPASEDTRDVSLLSYLLNKIAVDVSVMESGIATNIDIDIDQSFAPCKEFSRDNIWFINENICVIDESTEEIDQTYESHDDELKTTALIQSGNERIPPEEQELPAEERSLLDENAEENSKKNGVTPSDSEESDTSVSASCLESTADDSRVDSEGTADIHIGEPCYELDYAECGYVIMSSDVSEEEFIPLAHEIPSVTAVIMSSDVSEEELIPLAHEIPSVTAVIMSSDVSKEEFIPLAHEIPSVTAVIMSSDVSEEEFIPLAHEISSVTAADPLMIHCLGNPLTKQVQGDNEGTTLTDQPSKQVQGEIEGTTLTSQTPEQVQCEIEGTTLTDQPSKQVQG